MARRRPSRRVRMESGLGTQRQSDAAPGIARAMRGLRSFAYQANTAYGKLTDTLKRLIPVVQSLGSAWGRLRTGIQQSTADVNACASAFNRCKLAMVTAIPVAALLQRQMAMLGTTCQAAGVFGQTAFASMAASAAKASVASAGLLIPLAGIAAVAGTAYVALYKWAEVPAILKPILLIASPLVFAIRALATAWNAATLPARAFSSALDTIKTAIAETARAIPRLVAGLAGMATSATRSAANLAANVGRSLLDAGAATTRFVAHAAGSLERLGLSLGNLGSQIMSLGGRITRPLEESADEFARAGVAATKLADAAGVTVTEMTALGYAAERSGSNMAEVSSAIETTSARLAESSGMFKRLGLDVARLSEMSPAKRFEEIGVAIASLESPLERAEAASALFGTSSRELIDMFAKGRGGLAEMRREAERLGLVMSGPQAKAAKELSDATKGVQDSMLGLWRTLGAAVAPQLTETARNMATLVKSVTAWVSKNQPLIAQVFRVAAAVVAVGTGLSTLASVLAVATPGIVALTAAVAAGWLAWGRYGDSFQKTLGNVLGGLRKLQQEATRVMGGIWDAIQGGDLALAVDIAWLGVQRAWVEGMRGLASITGETMGGIFNALANGDWKSALGQAWAVVRQLYMQGAGAIDSVFVSLSDTIDGVVTYLRQQLNVALSELAKFTLSVLQQSSKVVDVLAKIDPSGKMDELQKSLAQSLKGSTLIKLSQDPTAANAALADASAQRGLGRLTDLQGRNTERAVRMADLAQRQDFEQRLAGGRAEGRGADVQDRLTKAIDAARLARMAAMAGNAGDVDQRNRLAAAADAARQGAASTTIGGATFSAAALTAQNGAGLNVQKEIAAAAKATARDVKRLADADARRGKEAAAAALIPVA